MSDNREWSDPKNGTPVPGSDGSYEQPKGTGEESTASAIPGDGSSRADLPGEARGLGTDAGTTAAPSVNQDPYSASTPQNPYGQGSPYAQGGTEIGASQNPYEQNPYGQASYGQTSTNYSQDSSGYGEQNTYGTGTTSYGQTNTSYGQASTSYGQDSSGYGEQNTYGTETTSYGQTSSGYGQDSLGQQAGYGQQAPAASGPVAGYPPAYDAAAMGAYGQPQAQQSTFNVLGLIGLIAGTLGLLLCWFALLGFPLALAGIVLGILGMLLKRFNAKRGLAISALIVSTIAIIASILVTVVAVALVNRASTTIETYSGYQYTPDSAIVDQEVTIVLEGSSSATFQVEAKVSNGMSGEHEYSKSEMLTDQTSAYSATHTMNISVSDYSNISLTVTSSDYQDKTSCKITVNGKVIDEKKDSPSSAFCYGDSIGSYL